MSGTAFSAALALHIAAGSTGLVLGPIAMLSTKRRGPHTVVGRVYYWVFVVLFLSALALSALDFRRVWWLALVGAGSYGLALVGYRAGRRRQPGWLAAHVTGMAGSYIAMVTALAVVNVYAMAGAGALAVMAWIAPTVIGTPIIWWINREIAHGRRPKAWRRGVAVQADRPGRPGPTPTMRHT